MINILVVGEVCEDVFIYGVCNRLCPEAPVPVMNPIITIKNSGMSGNVVENLKALENNIKVTHWFQKETIIKTRFVDKKTNHMFLRIDEGENLVSSFNFMIDNFEEFDIVIVSDYNKGFLTNDVLKTIGKSAKLSILDSKRKLTDEVVNSFTFVKLNESEAKNNFHLKNVQNIITTKGDKGAEFNGKIYKSPNPKETIDVSGAGDTFTASFILEYFKTKDVEKSIVYANEMSSIVVSKRGVATP